MSTEIKTRRGTLLEHQSFAGAVGEITVDTTTWTPRLHDGIKLGGHSAELKSIARSLNVQDDEVIYSTDTTTSLGDVLYIYNYINEVIYAKPATVGAGEVIVSVVGDQLETDVQFYTMLKVNPVTSENIGSFVKYQALNIDDMLLGLTVDAVTVSPRIGQWWSSGDTSWVRTGVSNNLSDFEQKSVLLYAGDFGIVVNSAAHRESNRIALKAAHDSAIMGSKIWLPTGAIQTEVEIGQDAILTITRNVSFTSSGLRSTRILGYGEADGVIDVRITDNDGFLDVRGWEMSEITVDNIDGKDAIRFISGGFAILSSLIHKCGFSSGPKDATATFSNYSINMQAPVLSHSLVELCTIESSYLHIGDAVTFRKNLAAAEIGIAFIVTTDPGVYNVTFDSNTIVNRDGALHLIDGDAVRFINNQCEQFLAFGANQSPISTMIRLEGRTRKIRSCVIRENNLGGGTNVDYLIHITNADTIDIDDNKLVPVNVAEIYCASNTERVKFGMLNRQDDSISNSRPDTLWRTKFENNSLLNVNIPMDFSAYLLNGWTFTGATGKHAYIDEVGALHFIASVVGGTIVADTVILQFPAGVGVIHPQETLTNGWVTGSSSHFSAGGSYAEIQYLGGGTRIRVKDFKTNSPAILPTFQLNTNVATGGV